MVWYVQPVPGTPLCGHVPGLYQLLWSHSVGVEIVYASEQYMNWQCKRNSKLESIAMYKS